MVFSTEFRRGRFLTIAGLGVTLTLLLVPGQAFAAEDARQVWKQYEAAAKRGLSNAEREAWVSAFEREIERPTTSGPMRRRLLNEAGALYRSLGRPEKAVAAFERLYEDSLASEDALDDRLLALENLMFNAARPKDDESYRRAASLAESYLLAAKEYVKSSQATTAAVSRLARASQMIAAVHLRAAKTVYPQGSAESRTAALAAVEQLQTLIGLEQFQYQKRSQILMDLGETYTLLEQFGDAVKAFEAAASVDDGGVPKSYALRLAIEARYPNREDRIKPILDVLAQVPPDSHTNALKQQLGFCYLDLKRWDEAIGVFSDLQTAGAEETNDVIAYNMFLLATALRRSDRLEEAEAVLKTVVERYPKTAVTTDLVVREREIIAREQPATQPTN